MLFLRQPLREFKISSSWVWGSQAGQQVPVTSCLKDPPTLGSGAPGRGCGPEEVSGSRAGAPLQVEVPSGSPMWDGTRAEPCRPPLCSTSLGVPSPLSLSPGSQGGADGNCRWLIRVTDGELEGVGGREGIAGTGFLARPLADPRPDPCVPPFPCLSPSEPPGGAQAAATGGDMDVRVGAEELQASWQKWSWVGVPPLLLLSLHMSRLPSIGCWRHPQIPEDGGLRAILCQ